MQLKRIYQLDISIVSYILASKGLLKKLVKTSVLNYNTIPPNNSIFAATIFSFEPSIYK